MGKRRRQRRKRPSERRDRPREMLTKTWRERGRFQTGETEIGEEESRSEWQSATEGRELSLLSIPSRRTQKTPPRGGDANGHRLLGL